MFFDNVVFAGVLTVGLMVLFFVGFGFLSGETRTSVKTIGFSRLHEHARHFGRLRSPFFCPRFNQHRSHF